jgi:hypothetical protein
LTQRLCETVALPLIPVSTTTVNLLKSLFSGYFSGLEKL